MKKQFSDVYSEYGAPMGRREVDGDLEASVKLSLFCVNMVDGDYDDGGAYWGGYPSLPLFCARTMGVADTEVLRFFRAKSREAAKQLVKAEYPNAKFYR